MIYRVTRKFSFCAAHRLYNYKGKCNNVHGHNYTVEVTAESRVLDGLGMVVDFKELKRVEGWVEIYWDHKLLVNKEDAKLINTGAGGYSFEINPTVEHMTECLLEHMNRVVFDKTDIIITKIRMYETDNCYAEVQLEQAQIVLIKEGREHAPN